MRTKIVVGALAALGVAGLVALAWGGRYLVGIASASGYQTAAEAAYDRDDFDDTIRNCNRVIGLRPKHPTAYLWRACAYEAKEDYGQAIADYSTAIRLGEDSAYVYGNRSRAYAEQEQFDAAIEDANRAIQREPEEAEHYAARGYVHRLQGDYARMVADYSLALALEPTDGDNRAARGYAYSKLGNWERAFADYDEGVKQDPSAVSAHLRRAEAYSAHGDWSKALRDLREAVRLGPGEAEAQNDLAWMLATSPDGATRDGSEAVEVATRACESTQWNQWTYIDTLAAAYAEAGDFGKAVQWQKQALTLNTVTNQSRSDMLRRLAGFEQRQPAREPPR